MVVRIGLGMVHEHYDHLMRNFEEPTLIRDRRNGMSRRINCCLGSLLASSIAFFCVTTVLAEPTDSSDPSTLDQAIARYIRSHPEVVEEALKALEVRRETERRVRIRQAISAHQNELWYDPDSPVSGNPSGDVTVVEFFDYQCGYCKRVAGSVTKLQQEDPGVRIVYKDFPILGEASVYAAHAALAAHAQGKHQLFHETLLASKKEMSLEEMLTIAKSLGLDHERLQNDMRLSKWDSIIERNRSLAETLSIAGTPGFIIGGELYPGALTFEEIKRLVQRARSQ
jgi:protein-disulfide isomerase